MTDPPRPARLHVWDGTRNLPDWLRPGLHHWDGGQLVIHHRDGDGRPRPGWTIVLWTTGDVTVASPRIAEREYGPDGVYARLARAEATVQRVTALYEQWVKAGPPPLGTPIARWWDRRLAELHDAIQPPADQQEQT